MIATARHVSGPDQELITLEQACRHLRIRPGVDDEVVTSLIRVAREMLEGQQGLLGGVSIAPQIWAWNPGSLSPYGFICPIWPLISVDVFKVRVDGVMVSIPEEDIFHIGNEVYPSKGRWDFYVTSPLDIQVEFTAGYLDPPYPLIQAMLLIIGHLYDQRNGATDRELKEIPLGASTIISQYRRL